MLTASRSAPPEDLAATFIPADLATEDGAAELGGRVLDRVGGVDVLVNNAGAASAPAPAPAPADTMPNTLVIDQAADRFLVTDSTGGRVWQSPSPGGEPSVWSAGPALAPSGFFGANGLKLHAGAVWVSNYDLGTIVRIPVEQSGAAGSAAVHAMGLAGIDDFDFTGRGDEILAALNDTSELVGVAADGTHRVLLDGDDGLQVTTAVVVREDTAYHQWRAPRGDRPALRAARLVEQRLPGRPPPG